MSGKKKANDEWIQLVGDTDGDMLVLKEIRKQRELMEGSAKSYYENDDDDEESDHMTDIFTIKARDEEAEALSKKLFNILASDDVSKLKKFLEQHPTVNLCEIRGENDVTALNFAIIKNKRKVALHLVSIATNELLLDEVSVIVQRVQSQRNCLMLLVDMKISCQELFNALLERLCRLPELVRDNFARQSVLCELEGQRPCNMNCLHLAASRGHYEFIKPLCVKLGLGVNEKNNKGDTPLLLATRGNHMSTIRLLVDLGAQVDSENDKGSTPLHWAVRYGFNFVAEYLITQGRADVNHMRAHGLGTPLVLAAALGNSFIIKLLLEYGAKVNEPISGGQTALHLGTGEGHLSCAQQLIKYGADVNAADDMGNTPLLLAVKGKHRRVAILLLRSGADVERKNRRGEMVWDFAVQANHKLLADLVSTYWEEQSKARGCNVTGTFEKTKTPLHAAVIVKDTSALKLLLSLKADPHSRDVNGNTFYHIAAIENYACIFTDFAPYISFNAINSSGDTPLHVACRHGNSDAVNALVDNPYGLLSRNRNGETPLHVVAKSPKASVDVIRRVVSSIMLAENLTLLDARDLHGNTALHLAARANRPNAIDALYLLDINVTNNDGDSALHVAVKLGYLSVVQAILRVFWEESTGADIDQADTEGKTALHLLADAGESSVVYDLLAQGACLTARNADGNTVLHSLAAKTVNEPHNNDRFFDVLHTIVSTAPMWWCRKHDLLLPEVDSELYRQYRRSSNIFLTRHVKNSDGLSVISYAAGIGAGEFLRHVLNLSDVYKWRGRKPRTYEYDVTCFTPETMSASIGVKSSPSSAVSKPWADVKSLETDCSHQQDIRHITAELLSKWEHEEREPLLKHIVNMEDEVAASHLLDITPIRQLTDSYWKTYRLVNLILLVLHVAYMALFSAYSIPLLAESVASYSTSRNSTNSTRSKSSVDLDSELNQTTYSGMTNDTNVTFLTGSLPGPAAASGHMSIIATFLVYPGILIGFECYHWIRQIYHLVHQTSTNPRGVILYVSQITFVDFHGAISAFFFGHVMHWVSMAFCISVIGWYYADAMRDRSEPILLSVSLLSGWLFSIVFTKGFRTVHSFSIMLRSIVSRDIVRITFVFIFILMAFSYAIYALFLVSPEAVAMYPTPGATVFLLFNLMVYIASLFDADFNAAFAGAGKTEYFVYVQVVYIMFIVIANLTFINIMIAMLSDTYGDILSQQGITWRVNSLRHAFGVNRALPFLWRFFATSHRTRNLHLSVDGSRWILVVPMQDQANDDDTQRSAVSASDSIRKSLLKLEAKVTDLARMVDTVSAAMASHPKILPDLVARGRRGNRQLSVKHSIVESLYKLSIDFTEKLDTA